MSRFLASANEESSSGTFDSEAENRFASFSAFGLTVTVYFTIFNTENYCTDTAQHVCGLYLRTSSREGGRYSVARQQR